jgi:hypothetical protein
MRYTWDDSAVSLDGEPVASTDASFWGRGPSLEIDGDAWSFRIDVDGMRAEQPDGPSIVMERGAPWRARSPMTGPSGRTDLQRTTSWLLGKLHFDVEQGGEVIGAVAPVGPWRYRPALDLRKALSHAEAVFLLWAAYRINDTRPVARIKAGPAGASAGGGTE